MNELTIRTYATNQARQALTNMALNGQPSWQITSFAVGTGGYHPANVTQTLQVDPTRTELMNEIFRDTYDHTEQINQFGTVFVCHLQEDEALGGIGEVGLVAMYTSGESAGQEFLFSIAHTGYITKTNNTTVTFRIALPF